MWQTLAGHLVKVISPVIKKYVCDEVNNSFGAFKIEVLIFETIHKLERRNCCSYVM
jgi:hypothetical protein